MMQARTMMVLAALIAGMSITSLLLVLLEPNPVAPASGGMLSVADTSQGQLAQAGKNYEKIAATDVPMRPWSRIVIHDSGSERGSAASVEAIMNQTPDQRVGYHFVVNNGTDQANGIIEIGYRWKHQFEAVGSLDPQLQANEAASSGMLAVCVIGDATARDLTSKQEDSLAWLVKTLREQLNTPDLPVTVDFGDSEVDRRRAWLLKKKL